MSSPGARASSKRFVLHAFKKTQTSDEFKRALDNRITALEQEVKSLRTFTPTTRAAGGAPRGAPRRGGAAGVRGGLCGHGGKRGGGGKSQQRPERLCFCCGSNGHLAEACSKAHPAAVALIKKQRQERDEARARNADSSTEGNYSGVSALPVTVSAIRTLHFHSATKFHTGHVPVTRRHRLEELSIELRWQMCALRLSNKATLLQRRTIRCGDVYYREYKSAVRYAAPWFSLWHASQQAKRTYVRQRGGILKTAREPRSHVQLLHQAHDITVMPVSKYLVANTEHAAMRSAHHGNSVVHLYRSQVEIVRPKLGACVDTGAQMGLAASKSDILANTDDYFTTLGATGHTAHLPGILMGVETEDEDGEPLIVVVPAISVSNPKAAESLLPAGRLMEAGYKIEFRIPSDAAEDGYAHMPLYGGTFITPAPSRVIIMEYQHSTWRLPLPRVKSRIQKAPNFSSLNAFGSLQNLPTDDANSTGRVRDEMTTRSEEDQRRFELKCAREKEVAILHDVSHRHNRGLLNDLIAAGVEASETLHFETQLQMVCSKSWQTSISYKITFNS